MDQEPPARLSSAPLRGAEKESLAEERLAESPVIRPRPSIAFQPPAAAPAINAAAARLTPDQLEEILATSIQRLREEEEPLLKLGYLTTLKACAADLERRLSEGKAD